MKYCSKCGAQIPDDAKFCPLCGASVTEQSTYQENVQQFNNFNCEDKYSVLTILGIVFTFLSSVIGLILSILAYNEAKRTFSPKNQSLSKTGIILSCVFIGLEVVVGIIMVWLVITGVIAGLTIPMASICLL